MIISDEYIEELVVTYIFPNLSDCEVLRAKTLSITKLFINYFEENPHRKDTEFFFNAIDMYGESLNYIFQKYAIKEDVKELKANLQFVGLSYIFIIISKKFGTSIFNLKSHLLEIEKTSLKLQKLLEIDIEIGVLHLSFISEVVTQNRNDSKIELNPLLGQEKYKSLQEDLKLLDNLHLEFSNTPLAKWLQHGKSGPKENSALNVWVRSLAEIWIGQLNRELSFSKDEYSGRNNFLDFAEECLWAIHPSIGNDAVRNTYEKLRSSGQLDYLS